MTIPARRAALILITLVVAGTCVRLGIWQLDRLDVRRQENERISGALRAAPLVLRSAPGLGSAHRRASARGTFDARSEFVLAGRALQGRAGDHLLTALRLEDGSRLLVDRGWVPIGARIPAPDGIVTVEGILLPPESEDAPPTDDGIVTLVDPAAIGRQLPYRLAPVYLLLRAQDPSPRASPTPAPPPQLSEGPHLSYAIQWFSFATVAVVGGAVLLRRDARAMPGEAQ